jgi:SpoU rRNA Methylase family
MDAFGIQNVDIIIDPQQYYGKAALRQKRHMRTAVGSAQWLTIHYHLSTDDAIQSIREQYHHDNHGHERSSSKGIVFYASDLDPSSQDIRTIKWDCNLPKNYNNHRIGTNHNDDDDDDHDEVIDPAICIVMGNEERGISDTMKQLVDYTFTLPMVGFAESYNLSVATAITLAHLSAQSSLSSLSSNMNDVKKENIGPIRPGDLHPHHFQWLLLKGLINSVAQKRIIVPLLKRENIVLPPDILRTI